MSLWRHDPDAAAAELVRRSLPSLDLAGAILVANAGPQTRAALAGIVPAPAVWCRRASDAFAATPWPEGGPFDVVLLRHAKARDEQEMHLHAGLSVLRPGGRLIVVGGNDEGIRSAVTGLDALCGASLTLATRSHGRIVGASRPDQIAGLRASLPQWRRTLHLEFVGPPRPWVSYPGVFAADRIDEGTRALLAHLPALKASARVLDYGCGSGIVAGALRAAQPGVTVDLLDADSVALLAAAENVPGARTVLGSDLAAAGPARYDAIVSNPPLHAGIADDLGPLRHLVQAAPKHLKPRGLLQIVVQRRVPVEPLLAEHMTDVEAVAQDARFGVWRARAR